MNVPSGAGPGAELRDYLAAERTFLAWIRTGLALMGFGFVVARFGLFLEELPIFRQSGLETRSGGLSLWFGTTLIVMGVVVNISSAWQHTRLVRQLESGAPPRCRPVGQNIAIALLLALMGLAMAIYLVSVRSSSANTYSENKKEVHVAQTGPASAKGIIEKPSNHSVDDTVERLKNILQAKGVALFALIDHSGEAERAGMKMRPTKLLIFGSPKAGTPLMIAAPTIAIDLPLKILVWEDAQGRTRISFNSPEYLRDRHGLPQELLQNISVAETLADKAGE